MSAFCLVLLVAAQPTTATRPRTVLLVSHAEKPPDGDPSGGLSAAGVKRAEALPALFRKTAGRPDPFPTPDVVFAAKNTDHSHRSVRTVKPLAASLGLKLRSDVVNDDYPKLVEELAGPTYAGKVVLVCWHHGNLPALARALGAAGVPNKWKDEVFDRVWQLDFAADGSVTRRDRPQRLLPGDADE